MRAVQPTVPGRDSVHCSVPNLDPETTTGFREGFALGSLEVGVLIYPPSVAADTLLADMGSQSPINRYLRLGHASSSLELQWTGE